MGFFFTLLFLLTAYLTPPLLFGPAGEYHLELGLMALAFGFSIPNLLESRVLKSWPGLALFGLTSTVFLSVAVTGWVTGGMYALLGFLQPIFAFLLCAINCREKRHFQLIVLVLFVGSVVFILLGARDVHNQVIPSPYIYGDYSLMRIRGLGFVNDPNDFAQLMVSLIPALFLWKRPGVGFEVFLLGLPISVLLTGMYLTHSRGSIVALAAVILIAARRKLTTLPAALLSGLLFAGGLAAGWTGGREVSMDGGADRLDLWAAGLEKIKTHPLFGVGVGNFADGIGHTAHNTVVVCAAEVGLVGFFFWVLFVFSSIRKGVLYDKAARVAAATEAEELKLPTSVPRSFARRERADEVVNVRGSGLASPFALSVSPASAAAQPRPGTFAQRAMAGVPAAVPVMPAAQGPALRGALNQSNEMGAAELSEIIRVLVTSLTGFLVAGWFLSRAFSIWLFMYCGMFYAATRIGARIGIKPLADSKAFTVRWTLFVAGALLVAMSVILRLRNLGL